MKRIIITFTTLMLATTSAFAQLSPDQMRAEMAKPDGHKMCPSNNEYSIIALRDACNHGRDSNSCGNGSDFDQACGKHPHDPLELGSQFITHPAGCSSKRAVVQSI